MRMDTDQMERINWEIKKSLLFDQTNRIKSSKKYKNVKFDDPEEKQLSAKKPKQALMDLSKLEDSFVTLDRISKLERMSKKKEKDKKLVSEVMASVEDFRIYDGDKVSMKTIVEVFSSIGYELSKIQINEVFLLMEAGRSFDWSRLEKWLKKNTTFIGKSEL